MTKRIFRNILLTAVLALLLGAALLVGTLYSVYESRITQALRTEAEYVARMLAVNGDDPACLRDLGPESRVTLIAPDGTVLFDDSADETSMDNHAGRPEVQAALAQGTGESVRYSDTLSEVTMYHASITAGGNVLRMASTRSSVWGLFLSVAPQLCLMLLLAAAVSLLIARHAARQIVMPINSIDLDEPLQSRVYDELTPLLTRMDAQRTQIRLQMRDLSRAHADLNAIMANMREGLVLVDRENRILSVNGSAAAIFGARGTGAVGGSLTQICREGAVLEAVDAAQRGEYGDVALPMNGRRYHVFVSPVLRDGRVRGVVLLAQDVSAQYEAEESRREFTANVSHELKTPLTSISGYAEIIESGIARPEDVPLFAGKIRTEARRLVALVNDILELSRLDEKQGLGGMETVALLPMLQSLRESFLPAAGEKGVALTLSGSDAAVQGYQVLLRELFHNLIENAVKYTPSGGSVSISLDLREGRPVCTVTDTGIGIPPEHQARVFERFYRVDKSHSRQTGGTGLGLAIVKHAAEVNHARVELSSVPGEGTTVSVRF